jgi:hypothetical protein
MELGKQLKRRQQEATLHLAGLDPGNNTTILVDEAGAVQFASYVGSGNLADLLASRGGSGGEDTLKPGEYVIETGGATYYVGDLALRQSKDATTARGDTGRYANGHTLKLLMAAVGARYAGDVRLRLVTGVPAKLFKEQPDLRDRITQALIGEHFFIFHDQRGRHEVMLMVEHVVVQMEGVVALAALGERGKPVGVVDIGGGSTDIGWFDADGRVVDHRVASLPKGVERVCEVLSQQFRHKHGRELTSQERDAILANYLAGQDTTVYHRGPQVISLRQVRQAIATVRTEIISFLAQHWSIGEDGSVGADGAYVVLIGGGAYYFPDLAIDTELKRPAAPEQANAQAYAALAQRLEARGKWPPLQRGQ